jgi:hypothetical protein
MPKIIASVVITIGRKRVSPASTSAVLRSAPRARCWLAKSTSRIAFFVTKPMSRMRPIMLMMLKVVRVASSARMTPTIDSGIDSMMASGCRNDPNWLASTR